MITHFFACRGIYLLKDVSEINSWSNLDLAPSNHLLMTVLLSHCLIFPSYPMVEPMEDVSIRCLHITDALFTNKKERKMQGSPGKDKFCAGLRKTIMECNLLCQYQT